MNQDFASVWSERLKKLSPIFGLVVFVVAIFIVRKMAKKYSFHEILGAMAQIPTIRIVEAALVMILSYAVLSCYDLLALRFVNEPLAPKKTVFTSFVAFALTNNIGLANVAGTSVRLRYYSYFGLPPPTILKVIVFISFSFWTGFLGLSGYLFLFVPPEVPDQYAFSPLYLRLLGFVMLFAPALYLWLCYRQWKPAWMSKFGLELPDVRTAVLQVVVSALEWALAGLTLFILLPNVGSVDFVHFLSVFSTAQVLTLLSHVPGGIGVLEAVVIFFVSREGEPSAAALGSLLAFRCLYYFVPLAVAVASFLGFEVYRKRHLLSKPE